MPRPSQSSVHAQPEAPTSPRVALVCDWLTTPGGAEKVLLEFYHLYPDAPIYTSQYNPKRIDWFKDATVKTGWLRFFPSCLRKFLGPLRQLYFSHLDLSDYDLVISVTGAEAKGIKTKKETTSHLCYCHVPTQYYWQMYDSYLENPGFGVLNPLVRCVFKTLVKPLRQADYRAAQRPDQFITISQYAADQIQKYYHRDAVIIAPPVEVAQFAPKPCPKSRKSSQPQPKSAFPEYHYQPNQPVQTPEILCSDPPSYYIIACRQVTWKRVDLAIEACLAAKVPLLVVGDGPEHAHLQQLAQNSSLIKFLPWAKTAELAVYLRGAKAYLFPSLEPFGIAAVEALAAGCPVLAYHDGGSRDFVMPGKNGLLFTEQTAASLKSAILELEQRQKPFDRAKISRTAQKFSPQRFDQAIRRLVAKFLPPKPSLSTASCGKLSKEQGNITKIPCGKLAKLLLACFYLLPVVIFCSYYPIISLGANASMNFELSLPLIWLVLFDGVSFLVLLTLARAPRRPFPGITDRKIFLLSLFPFWATLSIFWSANPVRATLTAGIIWLLFFAIFSIVALLPLIITSLAAQKQTQKTAQKQEPTPELTQQLAQKRLSNRLITVFLAASVAVSAFCWLQAILDTVGFSRAETLLCAGCTYRSFGFPHPSGLAIEPQFMGNLLLAPALLTLFMLAWRRPEPSRKRFWGLVVVSLDILSTLFFTFSRGAIYAFAVALAVLLLFSLLQKRFRWSLIILPVLAFLISLTSQGIFAAVGPTSETFTSAVTKSIHQLSLGIIDLRSLAYEPPESAVQQLSYEKYVPTYVAESILKREHENSLSAASSDQPYFDGYVAESTNIRLGLNDLAVRTWLSYPGYDLVYVGYNCTQSNSVNLCSGSIGLSPRTIFIGVGLGGAGQAMYEFAPDETGSPKEIVQNQAFSLLLETGLIGLGLAIFGLVVAFCYQTQLFRPAPSSTSVPMPSNLRYHPALPLLVSLVIAYLITLCFFSGLPNALQIYLMPPFIYCIYLQYEIQ